MDAAAAFWIFLAAVIGAGAWAGARKEAEKHQTLRRLLDQGGTLDEPQLRELLRSLEKPPAWQPGMPVYTPPNHRRQCVVTGAILICVGVALMTFFGLFFLLYLNLGPPLDSPEGTGGAAGILVGAAVGVSVGVLGAGIWLVGRLFPAQPETTRALDAAASSSGADTSSSSTSAAQDRFAG